MSEVKFCIVYDVKDRFGISENLSNVFYTKEEVRQELSLFTNTLNIRVYELNPHDRLCPLCLSDEIV
jgi:hypothetical protein